MIERTTALRPVTQADWTFRAPVTGDGAAIHELIGRCPPLDLNSEYAYFLIGAHFAATSAVATDDRGRLMGAVTGYIRPDASDTLFVWQVAIDSRARGRGMASALLEAILNRSACESVRYLETTVTVSNEASRRLFRRFAREHGAALRTGDFIEADRFRAGRHETENLLKIGPIRPKPGRE